jgi:hypothetical protein
MEQTQRFQMLMRSLKRYTVMQVANIFEDSTIGLDLDKIREKINSLYQTLLTQAYKRENPVAAPDEIAEFLESNKLDFPTAEDTEAEDLMDLIDDLTNEDDLDPIDSDGKAPTVEQGVELKSKLHELGKTPKTTTVPLQKGMLTSAPDIQVKKRSSDPVATNGKGLSSNKDGKRRVKVGSLFSNIKDELASLKQRRRVGRKSMEDRL